MKIGPRRARSLLAASLLTVLAACGGQPPLENLYTEEPAQAGNFFLGASPVYAHLINMKDGSWVFRTITASDEPPDSAYLVRLNDLTPAFDTRVAECTPQLYPEAHRCNPANPFRDEDSGILDKLINGTIAVGTGGKITDITYAYETTFDETAFNRVVDEALANSALDRRRFLSLLATYDDELREARADLQAANEQMLATRTSSNFVELEIQPTIRGLMEYYEGDIDFTQLIDVEAAENAPTPVAELEAAEILPCEARKCVTKGETALAALRANTQSNREQFAAGTQPSSRLFNVRCNMVSYDGYGLEAECPAQVVASGDQPVPLPIDVTILSRDFDDLYPDFNIGDQDLRVEIDGGAVTFHNTTSEYVTVTAQTVYYNSTVHTSGLRLDVPPGIAVTRSLEEFVSQAIDIESRYLQMTPAKASGASFQFGFAVRYQLASQPEERTLHDLQTFNVGCVISNQIRPGTCRPESLADARGSEESRPVSVEPGAPM